MLSIKYLLLIVQKFLKVKARAAFLLWWFWQVAPMFGV
jgi:hypothetical protein